MARKWILNGNEIILGNVTFHRELKSAGDRVHGGGLFSFVEDPTVLLLYGESHDFGQITREQFLASELGKSLTKRGLNIHFTRLLTKKEAEEAYKKSETIEHNTNPDKG